MKNATRNWKTSILGGLLIALGMLQATEDPAKNPNATEQTVGLIVAGIGLLAAKDGDKSGTITNPKQ